MTAAEYSVNKCRIFKIKERGARLRRAHAKPPTQGGR
jgi:hypothetical protein